MASRDSVIGRCRSCSVTKPTETLAKDFTSGFLFCKKFAISRRRVVTREMKGITHVISISAFWDPFHQALNHLAFSSISLATLPPNMAIVAMFDPMVRRFARLDVEGWIIEEVP